MDHTIDALSYVTQLKGAFVGCDIHWYSETKKDGKWVCDQADTYTIEDEGKEGEYHDMDNFPNRDRDYWWFGFIQPGVRSEWDNSFPQTGLPDDMSPEVSRLITRWDSDGHSHGHLTRADFKAKLAEFANYRTEALINPELKAEAINHFVDRMEETISNLKSDVPDEDQRVVFFFDN